MQNVSENTGHGYGLPTYGLTQDPAACEHCAAAAPLLTKHIRACLAANACRVSQSFQPQTQLHVTMPLTGRRSGQRAQMLRTAMQPCRCTAADLALSAWSPMTCRHSTRSSNTQRPA